MQFSALSAEANILDRNTVLMFDAMYVRQHLEYNYFADCVTGVEALSAANRSPKPAQCLLVFMLKSIFHGWTQVIGHHFTTSKFAKDDLKSLLFSYLSAMDTAGVICRGIVCDQEPSHVSMFKSIGVTAEAPYMRCPSSGRKTSFGIRLIF